MKKPLQLSNDVIVAGMSKRGGWTRKTLAGWGVPWPPPKGWRKALTEGTPIPTENVGRNNDKPMRPNWDGKCSVCGDTPTVPLTGLCGPCTFGEAQTAGGNW